MIAGRICTFFFWYISMGEVYVEAGLDLQIGAIAPHGGRKLSLRSLPCKVSKFLTLPTYYSE
jgi:hypothetical protein